MFTILYSHHSIGVHQSDKPEWNGVWHKRKKSTGKSGRKKYVCVREGDAIPFIWFYFHFNSDTDREKSFLFQWLSQFVNALSISISHLYYYILSSSQSHRRCRCRRCRHCRNRLYRCQNDFRRLRQWGIIYYLSLSISYTSSHSNSSLAHQLPQFTVCVCVRVFALQFLSQY